MKLKIRKMTEQDAIKIMAWQYTAPYDWYNFEGSASEMGELIRDSYYSVVNENGFLVGLFCYGEPAQLLTGQRLNLYEDEAYLDIGLGMNPLLCGKGHGVSFMRVGMAYARDQIGVSKFRLTVADFNVRAMKTYLKIGFKEVASFDSVGKHFKVMCYDGEEEAAD